ncbi:ATP-dependent DNA helicase [Candidatus Lokiarchaeum ossiferum]|uniref:ATP-dependent DNA helicase n=1 Tax=Candidatus Lokiarchaeum ossiferum TaxID=2951803 RepID=A0ABY6HXI5_9ARCH|nr:ATP-dependent DNA helicase [Candidatus Lokiarchaeum sp. B-35]
MPETDPDKIDSFLKTTSKILGYHDFFPYDSYRPEQERVIQNISEAIALGKNAILIASNGTGKTIMALSAALPIALNDKKRKILFCSRTYTQNARVIQETKEITQKFAKLQIQETIGAVSLRGRNEMCPHKTLQRLQLPPQESMSLCSTLRKNKKCRYFNQLFKRKKTKGFQDEIDALANMPLDAQDLMDFSEQDDVCPYFLSKILLEHEDIIVCNYQWIFDPNIRENFLESLGVGLSDCIIIMDECHNLPEMANGINSFRLTPFGLRQALKDLEVTRAKFKLVNFVKNLRKMLEVVKDRITDEMELDPSKFIQTILNKNKLGSVRDIKDILLDLKDYGDAIEQEKIDQGQVPRNFIAPICEFFENFLERIDDPAYFACITLKNTSKGKSVALELKCLSPRSITDAIFKESFATLSLSGTLHPFTYTHLLGLNHSGKMLKIIKMKPPFPEENVKVLLTAELNTKGDQRTISMYREMLIAIKPILLNTPKNVGIFCASYEVVNGLWDNGLERLAKMCNKKAFREKNGLTASDNDIIVEQFRSYASRSDFNGAVLLGVSGGRNSEGEDFPGDQMNAVIICGVPFQRPTPSGNAKIAYYEKLFPRKGRVFGYIAPAMQRSNQGCGRPIRRMTDKGLIVLMDYRFGTYSPYLSDWVRRAMVKVPKHTGIIEQEVQKFFGK